MLEEKKLTEQESLELISAMIQKVKNSYHDTGIGSLLWGTVVFIASFVSFLRYRYNFTIGFDIWYWLPSFRKYIYQLKKISQAKLNVMMMMPSIPFGWCMA